MEIAVLVEPIENKGYRVTSLVPTRLILPRPGDFARFYRLGWQANRI